MNATATITPRQPVFSFSEGMPRYWHGGDIFRTHFFNTLSLSFPWGEWFFIQSVRHYKSEITDPKLSSDIKAFIHQEAVHIQQHHAWNKAIALHGYDTERMEKFSEKVLKKFFCKAFSPLSQLALTVGWEHLTAILSDTFLRHPEFSEGVDARYKKLWVWHTLEECEHKAVAFDVYQAVGGGPLRLRALMLLATFIYMVELTQFLCHFLKKDKALFSLKVWARGFAFLWLRPGFFRKALPGWFAYFKPGFHPWNHDNRDLIALHEASLQEAA